MKEKFYPIIIDKKGAIFTASITELNIEVQGNNQLEALKKCLDKKKDIIDQLINKKIPLPEVLKNDEINLLHFSSIKKITNFTLKSIMSALIFIITLSILLIALSPFFKGYLNSQYAKDHFNKFTKKFGISTCINNTCK